jgi:hypothetical protein
MKVKERRKEGKCSITKRGVEKGNLIWFGRFLRFGRWQKVPADFSTSLSHLGALPVFHLFL